jgi:hypothetical protein
VEDQGIGETDESDIGNTGYDTSYYQWVNLFLLIQCIVFLIPERIWHLAERGLIKEFGTGEAKSVIISDKQAMDVTVQRYYT